MSIKYRLRLIRSFGSVRYDHAACGGIAILDRRCDDCDTGSFGYDLLSGIHSGNLWVRGGKHRNFGCDTWPQRDPDFSFGVWCHAALPAVELYAATFSRSTGVTPVTAISARNFARSF